MTYQKWVEEIEHLCGPEKMHFCDGSDREAEEVAKIMIEAGSLVRLKKRSGSFWCHSHADDVARVEENTFICSLKSQDAGPTNNWADPSEMKQKLKKLFSGSMRGRTMYVIPYCMGPLGSPYAKAGIEISDSPYVVLNMKKMTRMGKKALPELSKGFVKGVHSVGVPLKKGEKDSFWPCNPENRYITHFPESEEIWSFGSGYGGNALLGKKCFALRIASVMGKKQGWLAEHMLILSLTNPKGEKKYIAAAFPSACGKTNLAMMTPTLPGWKVECVGDDIAWMHIGDDGRLYAINPEAGYFGVAPGTSFKSNPNAMKAIEKNTLFTNVALTEDGDVWWEGMTPNPPEHLISWLGKEWKKEETKTAAHPNARFTVSSKESPIYDKAAEKKEGVPISAILFGGRRSDTIPLVFESFDWQHGVFLGASTSSETTAAAKGAVGKLRHDPFAMLPFCGYHMGDYFTHWLEMGKKMQKPPAIYYVNWFRKDKTGKFLWPGFGENSRVLEWIFERADNKAGARKTFFGRIPERLSLEGIDVDFSKLFDIEKDEWEREVEELETYFQKFGDKMPPKLLEELAKLKKRVYE